MWVAGWAEANLRQVRPGQRANPKHFKAGRADLRAADMGEGGGWAAEILRGEGVGEGEKRRSKGSEI